MMARRDPWVNLLRTTTACAGAAFGGADAITVLPFTWALGKPDAFARRIARNTHLVLQEESAAGRVIDPAAGAWFIEKLTDDLARQGLGAVPGDRGQGRHGARRSRAVSCRARSAASPRRAPRTSRRVARS